MYRCKVVNNDEFKAIYKKVCRKNIMTNVLFRLILANIMILIIYYLASKVKSVISIVLFGITIILEGVTFYYYYKKEMKKLLKSIVNCKYDISFNEKGIGIYHDGITKEVKWKGVNRVLLEEEYFIIIYKVNGIPPNIFCFNFFDVEREELIKDIEKYIKVRRR